MTDWKDEAHRWFRAALGAWVEDQVWDDSQDTAAFFRACQRAVSDWQFALVERAESPIEAALFAYLLFASDGYNRLIWDPTPGQHPLPDWGAVLRWQDDVDGNRADFSITCCCKGITKTVVVECDGHDYHERTKEQARRDRSRDRAMVSKGITVLRFTGSEIYRDPARCAEEVERLVSRVMTALLDQAGVIRGQP
jgi:very-short-patch-repair endonuclease